MFEKLSCFFCLSFLHSLAASIMDISQNNLIKKYCKETSYVSLSIWLRLYITELKDTCVSSDQNEARVNMEEFLS